MWKPPIDYDTLPDEAIAQVIRVIYPEGDGYRIELRPTSSRQTVSRVSMVATVCDLCMEIAVCCDFALAR
jgi:hypothetical protein